jgi:hypothetical protein
LDKYDCSISVAKPKVANASKAGIFGAESHKFLAKNKKKKNIASGNIVLSTNLVSTDQRLSKEFWANPVSR